VQNEKKLPNGWQFLRRVHVARPARVGLSSLPDRERTRQVAHMFNKFPLLTRNTIWYLMILGGMALLAVIAGAVLVLLNSCTQ